MSDSINVPVAVQSLSQAIELSLNESTLGNYSADFSFTVINQIVKCYEVQIAYRDILCYCDKGCATFLVDSYGDKNTVELFDWEVDFQEFKKLIN